MTKVHCMQTSCEYWKKDGIGDNGLCGCDEIELGCDEIELDSDTICLTYGAHSEISPEYRETFWKRLKSTKDKHECKKEARGKRYELVGLVWFTDQDDRWGTDEVWFTEQKTGLRCKGKDINEERAEMIKGIVDSTSPVDDLPEALFDDL